MIMVLVSSLLETQNYDHPKILVKSHKKVSNSHTEKSCNFETYNIPEHKIQSPRSSSI